MSENPSDVGRRNAGTSSRGGASAGNEPIRAHGGNRDSHNRQQSPADLLPQITLPKGGGAIRGMGEKYSVNAVTGTSSFSVPLPLSAGRGFAPDASLAYDSGAGNGPFGFGWSVSLAAIARKTDKGLPLYHDDEEADTFVLSGAEDLVPVTGDDGTVLRTRRTVHQTDYEITSYIPRVEAGFAKIERWTDVATGISHWRTISGANVTSLFGLDALSLVADPANPRHIFNYKICRSWDSKGNVIVYNYKADDDADVDFSLTSQANRPSSARATQTYLKSIQYGNKTAWYADWTPDGTQTALPDDWAFELVLDYGDHQDGSPSPTLDRSWPARRDAFSTYRSGFEIRTTRLCRRILMFHRFAELGSDPCLVKSVDLTHLEGPIATYVQSITTRGYIRNPADGSYAASSMPSLDFRYAQPEIDPTIRFVDSDKLPAAAAGGDGRRYQWVDLDGEGLPGVLSEQAGGWYYARNISSLPEGPEDDIPSPRFEDVEAVRLAPSTAALSQGQQVMDLAGEGYQCLVEYRRPGAGYYEREHDYSWRAFTPFPSCPNISWDDPNLKHIDLDGDGHPDLLITEDEVFTWYPSLAKDGFGASRTVRKPTDEDSGPAVIFADQTQSISLADMSGDGLTDIMRVRNGEVCYWPNMGYGLFGAKVTMDGSPLFDTTDQFQEGRVRLADIDGSGTTDIVYLGRDSVTIWFNQCGNGWSSPQTLPQFPQVDDVATVAVLDLLGSGTSCIVWSSALPGEAPAPLSYINLMAEGKPHLLKSIVNNMGAETRIHYAPSTRFYLQDRAEGRPWITRLAYPVQCVERTETFDYVSRSKFTSRYAYHHGYFDAYEREFRGFGMVEQWDTDSFSRYAGAGMFTETPVTDGEDFHLPPVHTKTWFHTGAYLRSDAISRQYAGEYYAADPQAWPLPDSTLPDGMNAQETREACRALRGHPLRHEVYADDGSAQSAHPYTVEEHTYSVRRLQKLYSNRHAAFHAFETQSLSYHYERNPADPRIGHHVTLEVDGFGNVTKSAAVGYQRRAGASDGSHPEQARTLIVYTENSFSNRADQQDWRHLGLTVEAKAYELTGVQRASDAGPFMLSALRDAALSSTEIPYELVPASRAETSSAPTISRVSGSQPAGSFPVSTAQKRLIHQSRTLYLKDDISGSLPLGGVESLALPCESYILALTPGLLKSVFADKMSDADLSSLLSAEGGYLDVDTNGSWWIPGGRVFFSPDPPTPDPAFARAHFYQPIVSRDPFGNLSHVGYDFYDLVVVRTEDAVGNVSQAQIDYRVLMPSLVIDPNSNRTAVAFDALGMLTATALMGKDGQSEGDTLDDPTTKLEYDLFQWQRLRAPSVVHALAREQHGPANPRWQETYSYSDGLGREVMKKTQAPAGLAPIRNPDGSLQRDETGNVVSGQVTSRWVGSGRVVQDNKGNPIKKYEPYYSSTSSFEDEKEIVEQGVTPILRYDPLGRLIRTDMPDGTITRVEFDPWIQLTFDANDTVLESRWYADRVASTASPVEARAAGLTAAHANTPAVAHFDTLGRSFLSIADNGVAGQYATRSELDIDGQTLSVTDARGNCAVTTVYDMVGTPLHFAGMDGGENWQISNVAGNPVRSWNSRGFQVRHLFDDLHRPTQLIVREGSGPERLAEQSIYGESLPDAVAKNMRGKLWQHFDGAGVEVSVEYDFKGNPLQGSRQILSDYKDDVDWAANPTPGLETAVYSWSDTFDALNRRTTFTTPDGSINAHAYDEANHLLSIAISLKGANSMPYVSGVTYDAKGLRERIDYGNGVSTLYDHDPLTFRLRTLKTIRLSDGALLQQLSYTYDPVGNTVEIRDDAQQTIYFSNQVVTPSSQYEYDPLYRLTSATGRERVGQGAAGPPSPDDAGRSRLPHPNDGQAMGRYVERYTYDNVGNILRMLHNAGGNGWSVRYDYDTASNRLNATSLASDPDGIFSAAYRYDAEGSMTRMPHLPLLRWDFKNQLAATSRQVVNAGTAETTYYVYSASGERIRKVTERQAGPAQTPVRKEERVYVGGFEVYRSYSADGASIDIERETLHIMDDKQRIALVETRTQGNDPSPMQLTRYQLGNHLGSAVLELDDQGQIISYEEYYPYGCTSYQTVRSQTETPKRYRYTGKERDEESGLYYHGARYYAPWLARWTAADPAGTADGPNLYMYVRDNPIRFTDPGGFLSVASHIPNPGVAAAIMKTVKEYMAMRITTEQVKAIMLPNVPVKQRKEWLEHLQETTDSLNASMFKAGIKSRTSQAMFLATISEESGGLSQFTEGKSKYASSSSEFKGRGPVQLTTKRNYQAASDALKIGRRVDTVVGTGKKKHTETHYMGLIDDPELAASREYAFDIAAWFWTQGSGAEKVASGGHLLAKVQALAATAAATLLGFVPGKAAKQLAQQLESDAKAGLETVAPDDLDRFRRVSGIVNSGSPSGTVLGWGTRVAAYNRALHALGVTVTPEMQKELDEKSKAKDIIVAKKKK